MSWTEYNPDFDIGGQLIEVTRSDYIGYKAVYKILGKDKEGNVLLDMLEEHKPNEEKKKYQSGIRRVVVEEGWLFKDPKRKIKLFDND